jgi:tetratricopeptide (TPR) repeat protein
MPKLFSINFNADGRADLIMTRKAQIILQLFFIILVTWIAFSPSLKNGFTNWDDRELLLENDSVKGLSAWNLRSFFSGSYAGFGGYTPLVFLSYALEYHFFQLDPRIFHFDNLLLHILNTVLIYFLIFLISRNIRLSFITSLLFGIHPLHVESVAWIQGRKDLLFSLFFLAALISYLLFLRNKDKKKTYYVLSLLFFTCSLFSKVAAVAFPFVILLLESYSGQKLDRSALRRSVPFFALAIVFLFLAFITLRPGSSGIPSPKGHLTYLQNLSLFFYAFVFYISKTLLPIRLMARYSADIGQYPLDLVLNIAIFAVACALIYSVHRRKTEIVSFGAAFFVLTLMPTLPFHFAGQPYADRYMYLPLAGILFIFSAFFFDILPNKWPTRHFLKYGLGVLLGLAILLLGAKTWALGRVWHDSISLWTHVLKIDPQNAIAYLDRGQAYIDAGEMDKALADLNSLEKLEPKNPNIYNNRGIIFFKRGEFEKALNEFNRCLAVSPRFQLGYLNRAILWGHFREFEKSIRDLTAAIGINKHSYLAYYYRGIAYKELNLMDRALADFKAAYKISPTETARREIESLSGRKNP